MTTIINLMMQPLCAVVVDLIDDVPLVQAADTVKQQLGEALPVLGYALLAAVVFVLFRLYVGSKVR